MAITYQKLLESALMDWHADSHPLTKNGDGTPKTFYHGTRREFSEFDPMASNEHLMHFGTAHQANNVLGNRILPVYLRVKNPMRVEDFGESPLEWREAKANAIARGHDALVYANKHEGDGDSYAVFHPHQIKSVFAKSFDPKSKNISESTTPNGLPPEPGTAPVKEGHVRLYHQTDADNLESIRQHGISIAHAKGIEGPKAVYAGETPFYGSAEKIPTVEFQVEKEHWHPPFVTRDVKPEDFLAVHEPWHKHARYILDNPKVKEAVLRGEHDGLEGDYAKAIQHVKGLTESFLTEKDVRDRAWPEIPHFNGMQLAPYTEDENTQAASAYGDEPHEFMPGVRHVPFSTVHMQADDLFATPEKQKRVADLAEKIKASGKITPLLVAKRPDGSNYVAEGNHRARALKLLGFDGIPARVALPGQKQNSMFEAKKFTLSAGDMPFRTEDHRIKKGNPTEVIHKLHKNYDCSPYQINNGRCDEFANDIVKHVGGSIWSSGFDSELPSHDFVEHKGKFYDAEAPHGVDHWHQLPIFKKTLGQFDGLDKAMQDAHAKGPAWQKKPLKETTMTRKLTLTTVEQEKKLAELAEQTKDLDLFEASLKFAEAGLELTESHFDEKINSRFAADRLFIATHGTDAHRDQLVKDEDAMVRFGVAQRGHMTHLAALATDPHAMVRDHVARRGTRELAQALAQDKHPMVRSSAFNRLAELDQHNETEEPVHESVNSDEVHEVHALFSDSTRKLIGTHRNFGEAMNHASRCSFPTEIGSRQLAPGETPEYTYKQPLPEHLEAGTDIQLVEDGRFGKVKAWFESKSQGVFYVVGFPDGKTDMLQESAVRALDESTDQDVHASNKKMAKVVAMGEIYDHIDAAHEAMKAGNHEEAEKHMVHAKMKLVNPHLFEGFVDAWKDATSDTMGKVLTGFTAASIALGTAGLGWMAHDTVKEHQFAQKLEQVAPEDHKEYQKYKDMYTGNRRQVGKMTSAKDPEVEKRALEGMKSIRTKHQQLDEGFSDKLGEVFKIHLAKMKSALDAGDVETAKSHLRNAEMAADGATYLSPEGAKHLDKNGVPYMYEDRENEHAANLALAGESQPSRDKDKPYKLKRGDTTISHHSNENEAMGAWKNLTDNKGVKIHRELSEGTIDARHDHITRLYHDHLTGRSTSSHGAMKSAHDQATKAHGSEAAHHIAAASEASDNGQDHKEHLQKAKQASDAFHRGLNEHLEDGSSVQKHSAGDIYPWIVYAKAQGHPDNLHYGIISPMDQAGTLHGPSFMGAYEEAVRQKAEHGSKFAGSSVKPVSEGTEPNCMQCPSCLTMSDSATCAGCGCAMKDPSEVDPRLSEALPDEDRLAIMEYHDTAAKAMYLLEDRVRHSRLYIKHQARLKS